MGLNSDVFKGIEDKQSFAITAPVLECRICDRKEAADLLSAMTQMVQAAGRVAFILVPVTAKPGDFGVGAILQGAFPTLVASLDRLLTDGKRAFLAQDTFVTDIDRETIDLLLDVLKRQCDKYEKRVEEEARKRGE